MTVDMVNNPPHYKLNKSGVEAIEICRHMSFDLGNAFKYMYRARYKGTEKQDLEKARWYLRDRFDSGISESRRNKKTVVELLHKVAVTEEDSDYKELFTIFQKYTFELLYFGREREYDKLLSKIEEILQKIDGNREKSIDT